MVKYRGEVEGRRRGEYRTAELGAWFAKDEFLGKWGPDPMVASPARDIGGYLSRAGTFVDIESDNSRDRLCGLSVFHYAGATVSVKHIFFHNFPYPAAGNVSVKLASNDPLDDVVEQLRKRFPYLKEDASIDDLPDPCEGNDTCQQKS
jgi:hypothetical protein